MGKYMKKGKIAGDVAVMEFSQSGIGVRTRAKTLALRQNPELSYLQLRSRRLEKPQFHPPPPKPPKQGSRQGNINSNNTGCSGGGKTLGSSKKDQGQSQKSGSKRLGESVASGSSFRGGSKRRDGEESEGEEEKEKEGEVQFENLGSSSELFDGNGEGAVGIKVVEEIEENNLELDGNGRGTREGTPCSLTRDLDAIGTTPGSDVRSSGNRRRVREPIQRIIPTSREMDEFFATAELQQQMRFMEKYNFDVVNGVPLPGRYEWVKVHP